MSCQCGCGRLIHRDFTPGVPVEGKPHITRALGQWIVKTGKLGAWPTLSAHALAHAAKLNKPPEKKQWFEPYAFFVDTGPQSMEWTEYQDPKSWG